MKTLSAAVKTPTQPNFFKKWESVYIKCQEYFDFSYKTGSFPLILYFTRLSIMVFYYCQIKIILKHYLVSLYHQDGEIPFTSSSENSGQNTKCSHLKTLNANRSRWFREGSETLKNQFNGGFHTPSLHSWFDSRLNLTPRTTWQVQWQQQ